MAAKGYCSPTNVANFLGQTFTDAQKVHCEALIERAEVRIDTDTGRGWLVGAQTDEKHYYPTCDIFLRYAPVDSVTTVSGRSGMGEAAEALTVDEDYEARDLENGYIYLVSPGSYDLVLVTYTPTDTVPGDIKQACIELASTWMQAALMAGMYGVDSYSLPDLTVRFARSHVQQAVPPAVRAILDLYRYPVHG